MAKLLGVNGTVDEVAPADGKSFTLAELHALIGCDVVEAVPLENGWTMWLDEQGKLADPPKPENVRATTLLRQAGGFHWDYVAGTALVTLPGEVE